MREAFFDHRFFRNESNEFLGICLGYDHCAEHEWGFKGIVESFQIPLNDRRIYGIPKRTITQSVGDKLKLVTNVPLKGSSKINNGKTLKMDILLFSTYYYGSFDIKNYLDRLPLFNFSSDRFTGDDRIATSWDDHSFAIAVVEPEHKLFLKELHEAFSRLDIAIGNAANTNPFAGNGLTILIPSRASQEMHDSIFEMDEQHAQLFDDFDATGIKQKLDDANKKYFALSPSRKSDSFDRETKYDLVCWLNPFDQSKNNWGWFTIEELEEWIDGKGPIPKA